VYGVAAQRNNGDVQAIVEIRHHLQASFTIVFSRVFYRHGVFPLQLGHKFKREAAIDDIPVIFFPDRMLYASHFTLQHKLEIVNNMHGDPEVSCYTYARKSSWCIIQDPCTN